MSETLPYRLAAIDIDGTLVGPDKRIGPANRRAVARLREAGCRVVLASGRRHANMLPFYHDLGLDDFIVSAQGGLVKHPAGRDVIHHAPLAPALAMTLAAEAEACGSAVVLYPGTGAFVTRDTEWTERVRKDSGDELELVADARTIAARGPEKLIWADAPARVAALRVEIEQRYAGRALVTVTDPHLLEFTAVNATKAAGVAAIAARYEIDRRHVVAFGDGENDVPLLAWAGLGVAMPDAHPGAKAAADQVAPPGDPETSLARDIDMLMSSRPSAVGSRQWTGNGRPVAVGSSGR